MCTKVRHITFSTSEQEWWSWCWKRRREEDHRVTGLWHQTRRASLVLNPKSRSVLVARLDSSSWGDCTRTSESSQKLQRRHSGRWRSDSGLGHDQKRPSHCSSVWNESRGAIERWASLVITGQTCLVRILMFWTSLFLDQTLNLAKSSHFIGESSPN
jgi:hypothetical protein